MNKNTLHGLLLNMAIFEEVAAMGSFSGAADELQMTPSSVSKRINQLEENLGTKLIERTTRSMRLTSTGEQFLTHCENMLTEANFAVEAASLAQERLAGDLSIGVPKAFANHVLKPIFTKFLAQYPDINLHIVVTDDALDLLRANIDCAIEISHAPSDYLIARPLIPVRQVLCTTPQYLQSNPYPIHHPRDLLQHDCVYLGETPNDNEWQFIPVAANEFDSSSVGSPKDMDKKADDDNAVTVAVTGRYAVNHTGMRLDGVLNHLGIGCLPDFVAQPSLLNGDVVEVLPDWRLLSKYQGTAWLTFLPNKFQSLRLRALIDFLQDSLMTFSDLKA